MIITIIRFRKQQRKRFLLEKFVDKIRLISQIRFKVKTTNSFLKMENHFGVIWFS